MVTNDKGFIINYSYKRISCGFKTFLKIVWCVEEIQTQSVIICDKYDLSPFYLSSQDFLTGLTKTLQKIDNYKITSISLIK